MLRALEIIIMIVAIWIIVTQIVWPSWRGRRLFPIMRRTEATKEAAATLNTAHEIADQADSIEDLARAQARRREAEAHLNQAKGAIAPEAAPSTTNS